MRTKNSLFAAVVALLASSCSSMENARTETVRINGNCGMCKATIEEAAAQKGLSEAHWDPVSREATITFDSMRTTADVVLRWIAEAGYDNEHYLAPDEVYASLPPCCQYERTGKHIPVNPDPGHKGGHAHHAVPAAATDHPDHASHADTASQNPTAQTMVDPFAEVFQHYFALKDALVASDPEQARKHAGELDGAMHSVDPGALPEKQQAMWTEVMEGIMPHLHPLSETTGLEQQRMLFAKLTVPMTTLAQAAPQATPIYQDHCPMYNGGADWLSQEKAIKNPFYGSQMLGCGKVTGTIVR